MSTVMSRALRVYFEEISVKRKRLKTTITTLNEMRYRIFIPSKG